MAIRELANAYVQVNGIVLSNQANKVSIKREGEVMEATGFRAAFKQKVVGISDAGMDITFWLNYGASSVNEALSALYSENKTFEVAVKPKKGYASTSNPLYLMKEAQLPALPIELPGPKQLLAVSVEFINLGESGIEELYAKREGEAE